jgi:murein DD-endopeptidase MepM/ murein hydrolase activator NlpD
MKIKKFYYYSPDKLKLVQIENFVSKAVFGLLATFSFSIIITLIISKIIFQNELDNRFSWDSYAQKTLMANEISNLQSKYKVLYSQFEKLNNQTAALRVAVNLPSLDSVKNNYGIGGYEFNKILTTSNDKNKQEFNAIFDYVNKIETNIKFETSNFDQIKEKFEENKNLFNVLPAIRPVHAVIGDRFGIRIHPILHVKRMHYGLDFLANVGEHVISTGDGVVTFVGQLGGYGKVVKINHGFGYTTLYGHLSKYNVKKGQKVKRGDLIAFTGDTGSLSTGPHLHYEVSHNGVPLNPRNFLFDDVRLF